MSKKTGRPKEQGGHRRANISIDNLTHNILQKANNKSRFIEHCIRISMHSKLLAFYQSDVARSNDHTTFRTVVKFTWTPDDSANNAILSIRCYFRYLSQKGLRFRLCINENPTLPIEETASNTWTWSHIYTESSFGDRIQARPNQNSYDIEFQLQPIVHLDTAYVKDIKILLEVKEGLPTL